MPTSTRSSGYKKKPTTNPASKGVTGPSTYERNEHAGKTQATHEDVAAAKEYQKAIRTVPTGGKRKQHQGKSRGRAKRKERKQLHEARNTNIYNGSQKPRKGRSKKAQHERALAARGKAVRKILNIEKTKGKSTQTPYQSLKQTQVLREAREKELTGIKHKSLELFVNPKSDPATKKRSKAIAALAHSELARLGGRGVEARRIGGTGDAKHHGTTGVTALKMFQQGKRLKRRADVLSSEAAVLPATTKTRTNKNGGKEYYVPPSEVSKKTKGYLKGTVNKYRGGWMNAKEVKELPVKNLETKKYNKSNVAENLPEVAFTVGSTVAVPAAIGVLAKGVALGKEALAAGGAVRAAETAGSVEKAVEAGNVASKFTEGVPSTTGRGLSETIKKLGVDEGRGIARTVQEAGSVSKNIAGRSIPALADDIARTGMSEAKQVKVLENAASPVSKAVEGVATDSRVIAGAGSPEGVTASKILEAARSTEKWLRPLGNTAANATRRAAIVGVPTAAALTGIGIADKKFGEAALRDTHDLIAGFVPSTYQFLTASGDALIWGFSGGFYGYGSKQGSPARVQKMWNQMLESSPIALAFQGEFSKALREAEARPVSTLIETGGLYTAVGKTAGTFARSLPGEFGGLAGRDPYAVVGKIQDTQAYSPNLFTKQVQKANDKLGSKILDGVTWDKAKNEFVYKNRLQKFQAKTIGLQKTASLNRAIDEYAAMYDIGKRGQLADAEKMTGEIAKSLHRNKTIKSKTARELSPHAQWVIGTRIARSPETAVKDIIDYKTKRIDPHVRELERIGSKGTVLKDLKEKQKLLQSLMEHPEAVTNDFNWKASDLLNELEHGRQQELMAVGSLNPEQYEYSKWIPYAVHHMGAKWDDKLGHFSIDDNQVTIKQIKAHAKKEGVKGEPYFITTRQVDTGDGADGVRVMTLPSADNAKATGASVANGTADVTFTSVVRQAALSRHIADTHQFYLKILDQTGFRGNGVDEPLIKFTPKKKGDLLADGNKATGDMTGKQYAKYVAEHMVGQDIGFEMVPMNLKEFINRTKDIKDGEKWFNKDEASRIYQSVQNSLDKTMRDTPEDATDYWVLMPKQAIDRLKEHARVDAGVDSLVRKINREFKGSVLAFSPKWHIGNVVDMATRLFFEGAGTRSYANGQRLLNQLKKLPDGGQAYRDILSIMGHGHIGSAAEGLDQFVGVPKEMFAEYSSAQRRLLTTAIRLGPKGYKKLVYYGYRTPQKWSFKVAEEIENKARITSLGKVAMKEADRQGLRKVTDGWSHAINLSPKMIEDLSRGMTQDSNNVREFGRAVNKVMGDYTTMSPTFKRAVLSFAPFGLWARASIKWVLTLPKNSPIRVAMITTVNRMNEKERRKLGLSAFTKGERNEGWELGSIPVAGEPANVYRTNSFTSLGTLNDFEGLAGFMLPQYRNFLNAWEGKNWLGDEIVNANGTKLNESQRIGIMLQQALETFFAPVGIAHNIFAGGKPDPTFTVFKAGNPLKGFSRHEFKRPNQFEPDKTEEVEGRSLGSTIEHQFSPFYKTPNMYVENQEYMKEQEEEENGTKSTKDINDLFGVKKKTKKTKSNLDNLFGG